MLGMFIHSIIHLSSTTQIPNSEVSLSVYLAISHASKVYSLNVISSMIIQMLVNQRYSRQDPKERKKKASSQKVCLVLQPSNIPIGLNTHSMRG
jgi:hypothetical protein